MLLGKMSLTFYLLGNGAMRLAVGRSGDSTRIWTQIALNINGFNERQRLQYDPCLSEEHARFAGLTTSETLLRVGLICEEREMPNLVESRVVCLDALASPRITPLPVC
jgi:hypothetical protein